MTRKNQAHYKQLSIRDLQCTLDQLIAKFKELGIPSDGYIDTSQIESDYDIYVSWLRKETDDEYHNRLDLEAKWLKIKEEQEKRDRAEIERKEEELYLKLKKKYENKYPEEKKSYEN